MRDCNDRTLFPCEDRALAESLVETVNRYDPALERIEKLRQIALLLHDRLHREPDRPDDCRRSADYERVEVGGRDA